MWLVKKYFIDENKIKMQIEEYKKRPTKPKSRFQQRLEEVQKQRANQMNNKKK